MSSNALEEPVLDVVVTVIASHGVWLQVRNRAVFMSYDDFPGLKDAPMRKVLNVQEPTPGGLFWPDLGVAARVGGVGSA